MMTTEARQARCIIRGAPALVTFYPDSHIVRISAEGGRCFEEMRWLFGWQALLDALGQPEEARLPRDVTLDARSRTAPEPFAAPTGAAG